MKTTTLFAAILMTGSLSAEIVRLDNGLQFQVPSGWQAIRNANGASMMPPKPVAGAEGYAVAVLPAGTDPRNSSDLAKRTPAGAPVPFSAVGGSGTLYRYDFVENGQAGRVELYLVTLRSGAVGTVVALGSRELVPQRSAALMTIAASLAETAAPSAATGSLAQQWTARLSGKRLMQFSTYSSGLSGGMSSQRTLALGADGSYSFRKSSSVSIYVPGATGTSAGQNGQDGRWRIYEDNGRAMLELVSPTAGREVIVLTSEGSKTFLNGRRWLVE